MIGARGLTRHIDGTVKKPDELTMGTSGWIQTDPACRLLPPSTNDIQQFKAHLEDWYLKENIVKQFLFASVYESLIIEIHSLESVAAIWTAIKKWHQGKSKMYQITTYRKLTTMECSGDGDV